MSHQKSSNVTGFAKGKGSDSLTQAPSRSIFRGLEIFPDPVQVNKDQQDNSPAQEQLSLAKNIQT